MARPPPTRFPSLEAEPKSYISAVPPAYRTLTNTASSDSWSEYSNEKKRASWTNLVDSNENLNKYRVNQYPKVHDNTMMQRHTYFGSACQVGQTTSAPLARQSSSMSNMSDVISFAMPKGALPVHAEPVILHDQQGYPPSESLAPLPPIDVRPDVTPPTKRNRLQELKAMCCRPRLTLLCFVALLLLIIAAIIAIVVTQALSLPKTLQMMWQAPAAYRGDQNAANHIDMNAEVPDRIRFELKGAMPFKENFIAYYDFKSGKAVVVDEALKKNGNVFSCFVLAIDPKVAPNYQEMIKTASRSKSRISQTEGWDEEWTFVPSPLNSMTAKAMFNPPIPECINARWIQLDQSNMDQRSRKCTECHDFCLPEFGIQGNADGYLNIVHRNCFYLFVPEWRSYAQSNTMDQNQRDFEAFYRNRNAQNGDATGSKWIPLAGVSNQQGYNMMTTVLPPSPQMIPSPNNPNGGYSMQPYGLPNANVNQQQNQNGYQPYGMQPNQGVTNGGGFVSNPSNINQNSVYQNGMNGMSQQMANNLQSTGTNALNTLGNVATGIGQGVSNVYSNLQNVGAEVGRTVNQAVDSFGNVLNNAQNSISGVVNLPQAGSGTGSNMGYGRVPMGYGTGSGTPSGTLDWNNGGNGQQQSSSPQQTTYPGGYVPDVLKSTNLDAGIPGVNNPIYYNNPNERMGGLTGYAPNVVPSSSNGGSMQQTNDPRQMAGVVGMTSSSQSINGIPPSSGYVPDVVPYQPSNNNNVNFGRGR